MAGTARKTRSDKLDHDAIAEAALARLEEGESVREIANALGVSKGTVFNALEGEPYRERHARAHARSAEYWAEVATEAVEAATPKTWSVQRLRFDNARWQAAMRNPRRWGDKVDVTTGGEKLSPGVVVVPAETWGQKATDEG